jgi:hypothetical protein
MRTEPLGEVLTFSTASRSVVEHVLLDSMTLAELRQVALVRGGRSNLNGVPHVPGSEVSCPRCRRQIDESADVLVGIVSRNVSVSHVVCPDKSSLPY